MATVLKEFDHVTIIDSELVPSNNRFDPKEILQNLDYKRIIKMQFDRLDPNFQEFLTVNKNLSSSILLLLYSLIYLYTYSYFYTYYFLFLF